MPTYVVAMVSVEDAATYKKYTAKTPAIIEKHGGKFLTRGQEVKTLEGEAYKGRMVLLEFPDQASAEAWFNDPDYQEAIKFRHASSVTHSILMQGDN